MDEQTTKYENISVTVESGVKRRFNAFKALAGITATEALERLLDTMQHTQGLYVTTGTDSANPQEAQR